MATTHTPVTADQRWAANAVRVGFRRLEQYADATALEHAQLAESYPHSYSPAAVELGQRALHGTAAWYA